MIRSTCPACGPSTAACGLFILQSCRPWRACAMASERGALRPTRTAALTLGVIVPLVRRESHHRLVYLGGNSQRAIERLFRPFPRDRKRLCCRFPRGLDPRRSSHFAPRFLICLKIRIAGSPSRTIFARLRSLAGNIIALTTAERSFIVP